MQDYDALIVGGGPAGSTCARQLVRAGRRVLILDKAQFPRDKTCAGWVTPAVLESLEFDAEDYRRGRVFQPITGFRVGTMNGPMVESRYEQPVSFGIRRCEFDTYLLRRCGAEARLGESVRSIERRDGRWCINGSFSAPVLIGAGGHFCPVARHLGAKTGPERVVAAQEVEFEMTPEQRVRCAARADTPELYFCDDLMGYAWCFRKGDHLNIGLGRESNVRIAEHVSQFMARLKRDGRVPQDSPETFKGHAYILYGHTRRPLVGDGVLLIGDAAGLAYPQSGEGIRTAVESAILAAGTIVECDGDCSQDRLSAYADRLTRRLGEPQASDGWARHIPEALKRTLAHRLLATQWFTRHVVIDRWFLHRQQPALRAS